MQKICGFVVVRQPEWTATDLLRRNPKIGEKEYHGVDRLRWEDFEVAYYDRRLPDALLPVWHDLDRGNSDFSGVKVLKSFGQARKVLDFSGEKSEIIAIWSAELADIKGTIDADVALEYLGVDCFALGEWSILASGVFRQPEQFPETAAQLNRWGLLACDAGCKGVLDRYLQLSSTELVEPLMEDPLMTSISIFRVPGQSLRQAIGHSSTTTY